MAIFIYPKSLLESWAGISMKPSRSCPVMEASDDEFGTSDGGDDAADGDVDSGFGRFSDIVDYEGDSEMGYSEPGVNKDLDRQYTRFGMNIQEVDPETGKVKDSKTTKPSKSESRGRDYKSIMSSIRARRLGDAKTLYREIAGIASNYIGMYTAMPENYLPETMRDLVESISGTANISMGEQDPDTYTVATQKLIRDMEALGIAARKNNVVPDGIPESLISTIQISQLIYLFDTEKHIMQMMWSDDGGTRMLEPRRISNRTAEINRNMRGIGDNDEPLMPPVGENLYYSSFATWGEFQSKKGTATATQTSMKHTRYSMDIHGGTIVEYLGPEYSASATAIVPHTLFAKVCERIDADRSNIHKKAREVMMSQFHDDVKSVAANLMMFGYADMKKRFGIAPRRMEETTSPCFILLPKNQHGDFMSTKTCLQALVNMFTAYRREIANGQAKLVDRGGTQFDMFPSQDLTAKGVGTVTSYQDVTVDEFLGIIIDTLSRNISGPVKATRSFCSPELYLLITKDFALKRNARRVRVDGEWKISSGERVPLFDYLSSDIGSQHAFDINATANPYSHDSKMQLGETISYDDVLDYENDDVKQRTLSGYIDTFLDGKRRYMYAEMVGVPREDVPTIDAPEKEKIQYFADWLIHLSDIMGELGSTSYIARKPGNEIEVVISESDKDLYGRDTNIIDTWKKVWFNFKNRRTDADLYTADGGLDTEHYSPNTVGFVSKNKNIKNGVFTYASRILEWLRSFQHYDYTSSDIVAALTGSTDDFVKARDILNPYVEMVPLIIDIASSSEEGGSRNSEAVQFALRYITILQKELNADITSPAFIEPVLSYVNSHFGDREAMLKYSEDMPPVNRDEMLEWCVVRFFMSGIDRATQKLLPPDQVDETSGSSVATEDAVPKILQRYRAILAAKPKYLKRDAWLRQHNIKPENYDYLEQEASGKNPDARIIDMSVGEISGWLTDEYVKFGNTGEIILLFLGFIHIGTLVHDADLRAVSKFREDGATQRMHDISMHRMVRLTDAMREYGGAAFGSIIAGLVGDGGESLKKLLNVITSSEPFTYDELAAALDCEPEDGTFDQETLEHTIGQVIGTLSAMSFLVFNGIE